MRSPVESLFPGICIHVSAISAWSAVLNYEERFKQKDNLSRLFCSVNMLNEHDYNLTEEERARIFADNMESVIQSADVKNIKQVTLVFIPVIQEKHFYCVCFNLKDHKIEVLDNSATNVSFEAKYQKWPEKLRDAFSSYLESASHPAANILRETVPIRLEMPWCTTRNVIDCGVFLMRHMETYKGTSLKKWECGLSKECNNAGEISYKQRPLDELRYKYVAKILLSDVNQVRPFVEADVARYKRLTEDQRKRLDADAYDTILARLEKD
ncbi:putative Ulp1 protease family catalytic domain, papain-like cysteine peptidase superfamily [Helianthus annuus]|nr:putative Ulp1 protease family catalytic domain, papain-like cysteine peptidase superfamily [Helianthus annuus]